MPRSYPPVYFPVSLADVLGGLIGGGIPQSGIYFSSGQTALTFALHAISEARAVAGGEVIIPEFICNSVIHAVRSAGMQPAFCPIDPETWFYDADQLEGSINPRTAAVVIVYYFGLPPQLDAERETAVKTMLDGVGVVEDCAQAYGIGARPLLSDETICRIYSFGPGKSLPMDYGGMVCSSHAEWRERLDHAARSRPREGPLSGLLNLGRTWLRGLLLDPAIWKYTAAFVRPDAERSAVHRIGTEPAALLPRLSPAAIRYISRAGTTLSREIAHRRENALKLRDKLAGLPALSLPLGEALQAGVCVRFPVVFHHEEAAQRAARQLASAKILAGGASWSSYCGDRPGARAIERRLITLPTYGKSAAIADEMTEIVSRAVIGTQASG
jgi:dTDP-4-amino-4,6-dideoxygalactose transaminase